MSIKLGVFVGSPESNVKYSNTQKACICATLSLNTVYPTDFTNEPIKYFIW
jgi:hypothetical protein